MSEWPMLTDHFSFQEMTVTSRADLQERNRDYAMGVLKDLTATAELLEVLRAEVGPIVVHSGYRCPALNLMTPGSSPRSQHMLGQAADISLGGAQTFERVDWLFQKARALFARNKVGFGQLIREQKNDSVWVHVSLGAPWREAAKCGQVLVMENGLYRTVEVLLY